VVIDASKSVFIHPDIFDIIEDFKFTADYKNIEVELIGLGNRTKTKTFWTG